MIKLYKVSVSSSKTGWTARVMEYDARESKKSYIIETTSGVKRVSFDKINKYDTICTDSVSYCNRRMFITNKDDIAKTIDGAVSSIKNVLNKMLEELSANMSSAPKGAINPDKIVIEKYSDDCGLKSIKITDAML